MYSYGPPHMAVQKQDDQHEHTFSSYVRIRDVVLKTYLGRWTIGRSGERGSGISVLPARYDDDDDDYTKCLIESAIPFFGLLHFRLIMLSLNQGSNYCHFLIFGMTQHEIEYLSPGLLVNTLPTVLWSEALGNDYTNGTSIWVYRVWC